MFRSGKTFFQIECAAETCNGYFLNVIEKLNIENVDINSALLSLNKFSFPFLICQLFLQRKQKLLVHLHP